MLTDLKLRLLKPFQSLQPVELPPPGLYHFEQRNGTEKTRLHLRLEKDGQGLSLVNASRSLHLNPTAAFMAYLFFTKIPSGQAVPPLPAATASQVNKRATTTRNSLLI